MYTVMIVDDEQLICEGIRSKLIRINHPKISRIELAYNGVQAMRLAHEIQPDIIITDMNMPEMDGLTLIKQLSLANSEIFFIFISGHGDYNYVREAFKYGAVDYLLKPIRISELEKQINIAISKVKERSELEESSKKQPELHRKLVLDAILNVTIGNSAVTEDEQLSKEMNRIFIHPRYCISLLRLDSDTQLTRWIDSIEALLKDELKQSGSAEQLHLIVTKNVTEHIILILNMDEALTKEWLISYLHRSIEALNRSMSLAAAASISEIGDSISELNQLYKQAHKALFYRFLYENYRVLELKHAKEASSEFKLSKQQFEEIRGQIQALGAMNIAVFIDKWFDLRSQDTASVEHMKKLYEVMLSEIHHSINGQLIFDDQEKLKDFDEFHSLSSLKDYMKGYLFHVKRMITESSANDRTVIDIAKSFIKENYHRNINLTDVVNLLSMNYSYFSRLFKDETGMNFTAYIMKLRMEEAKRLLKDPTNRISEISGRVGYDNYYHFSRAFRNYTGMSPKNYRDAAPF
ncbi:response regulator [Paenibacillus sp. LHD-38]|uniref:response regulator n=1 Tax=Paenibacillus sp. LHD-38 TaxID=3072143 RepID=UPI00280D1E8F|nr:response regulator [Paenibacillus sp. LHD-38]MDQ8739022.1 response regulator [Paenibacillus sp. LHD-38]